MKGRCERCLHYQVRQDKENLHLMRVGCRMREEREKCKKYKRKR